MFKSNILLLVFFLALLLLAVYLARPEWLGIKPSSKLLWPDFDKEAIGEIRVSGISGEMGTKDGVREEKRLVKKEDRWLVASKDDFPADEELVEKTLTAVAETEIGEVASLQKDKWAEFGVDEAGIRVMMVVGVGARHDAPVQDAPVQFWVGKSGRDYQSSYVRRSGDDKIYLVSGNLGSLFGTREWREMRVMGKMAETGKIKGLEFKYRDSQLVLQKIGEEWMMSQPSATAAAKNRVEFVLNELKELRAIEATTSADGVNFDEPEIELTVVYGGGESAGQKTLLIDGQDESGKNRFVKLRDSQIIYLISLADAGVFERTVEDFLNPAAE